MQKFIYSFIVVFSFLLSANLLRAEDTRYFTALDDVPVMPGLEELAQQTVSFETPQGRIVRIAALARAGEYETMRFYRSALPALGWVTKDGLVYTRSGETLKISFDMMDGESYAYFNLEPGK